MHELDANILAPGAACFMVLRCYMCNTPVCFTRGQKYTLDWLGLHYALLAVQATHAILRVVLLLDLLQPSSMWPKIGLPWVRHTVEVVVKLPV